MMNSRQLSLMLVSLIYFCGSLDAYPLFDLFPELQKTMGYHQLIQEATPLTKLKNLGAAIGNSNVYIKRDDLTNSIYGGNKVRKLELLLGDALRSGACGVVTLGAACSNHTTATAVHATRAGLDCFCLHTHQLPTSYGRRNLMLSFLTGADLILFESKGARQLGMLELNKLYKETTGMPLYFIPVGGSNEFGAAAYLSATLELKKQIDDGLMPAPDSIVVPFGSGGTIAGIALGVALLGMKTTITVACVDGSALDTIETEVKKLFDQTVRFLHTQDKDFPLELTYPTEMITYLDATGPKYAAITESAAAAAALIKKHEDIFLDGTYSAKTCAVFIDQAQQAPEKTILFWHTFFANEYSSQLNDFDYTQLPDEYHAYFTAPLQKNDAALRQDMSVFKPLD